MFPYGSAASPWPLLASTLGPNGSAPAGVSANISNDYCSLSPGTLPNFAETGTYFNIAPYYFQPWAVAAGAGYWANTVVIGTTNGGNFIFTLPVTGAWANPVAVANSATELISGLKGRPISIAVDPEGNVYFTEDYTNGSASYNEGVFEIPAGETGLTAPSGQYPETSLPRVDPNLPNVTGVMIDAQGNLYIGDANLGVFMVPNPSGTPQTSAAVMLTPVPAQGEVAVDPARKILYVATTQKQSNGQADVAKVGIGFAEFGSSNVGIAASTAQPIDFSFNAAITPASFAIVEDGMTTPEFAISGGTCAVGTAATAQSYCTENLTFTPAAVGSASAKLLMLDATSNILASMVLHGTGVGATAQVSAGLETVIGSTLKTPNQVATDTLGDVYVADSGLHKVLMYAAGSTASSTPVSIGTGLTSPTGVAVDGVGDVFIADSGSVYEVPFGPKGLNASGQVTLVSGLGTSGLNLAADGLGDLYVADPTNARVIRLAGLGDSSAGALVQSEIMLTTGATPSAPSAVAVDSNNNLYVVDGSKLFEFTGGVGAPTAVLSSLNGATGIAVDPSGAVYISSASGTTRIPLVSGALVSADGTPIAPDVTNSSSVALDRSGNVYVTPAGGPHVTAVSTVGSLTLPAPSSLTSSTSATSTITNAGNAPLLVSGYTNSMTVVDSVTIADFTGADGTCVGDSTSPATGVASGATCQVVVTFNPGPGEQGTLTGYVEATSNAINAPITIDTTGTGLAESGSKTSVTVGSSAQVVNTPVTVTVTPSSGTGTPTGTVQVTYTSWTVSVPSKCATPPCAPTINPETVTASSALKNGSASFTLAPVLAGSQTFAVGYSGDRVYGRSTGTQTATVAKSSITGFIADPNPPPYLPFTLEQDGSTSYDGSQAYFQYNMPVTVNTAEGVPTGTLTFMDNSSTCPPGTSATGVGAAVCALTSTSGIACPLNVGAGVQYVVNSGTPTANANATAIFTTSCLPMPSFTTYTPVISTHYITPVYSGDANFLGATDPVSSLFQVLRSPMVIITSTPATLSVAPGSTASATLTLTSLLGYGYSGKNGTGNDYNFPVTLACDNLPPHTECTFTYPTTVNANQPTAANSVQIPCSGTTSAADNCSPGTVTVTINTDVSAGTTSSQNAAAASVTLAAIFGLGTIGLFFRRREFEKWRRLFMLLLMVVGGALAVTLTACNTTNIAPSAQLSTPAGTYPVSITAAQVGTQCVPLSGPGSNCTTPSGGSGVLAYGSNNQVSVPFYINVTIQ
jgi:sugar lactone lactonase YvrE